MLEILEDFVIVHILYSSIMNFKLYQNSYFKLTVILNYYKSF